MKSGEVARFVLPFATTITFLLPFDRILDRFRTMVNVWGDLVCATVVDHFVTAAAKKRTKANNLNISKNTNTSAQKQLEKFMKKQSLLRHTAIETNKLH